MKFFLTPFVFLFFAGCDFNNERTTTPDKTLRRIEVFGKQFSWIIRYAGADNVLGKSNYLFITENNPLGLDSTDASGYDDIIVTDTFFLPVNQEAQLELRSRDVLHSAYFPQLRAQMNLVPGMNTYLKLRPEKTTTEMRTNLRDPKFDYMLLCNKLCGADHFAMTMKVVVGTQHEFKSWLQRHKPFFDGKKPPGIVINKEAESEKQG
jgi:cytochrome c oxidase subunit 2